MLKKITKWETEDGTVFDTQEEAEDYMFEQDKEVVGHTTEQERSRAPSAPLPQEVMDALDRMDALLKPGLGLLAVGDESATAQASRRDMATIRAALATAPQQPEATPVQMPEPAAVVVAIDRKVFADGVLRVSSASISFCDLEKVDLGSNLYTKQQVVSLLKSQGISVKTSK